ncbi:Alpha-N-acetylgalactosaminidase [Eumeta japonica]|uniref:Alpha-galactosidase n=1 Tax=Eumeta variegata TaxID=151549 RepID=A0A4C1WHC8_EUMVA|nr:Alpha-N-acetylgalactosaminidase [Eumeta japonica]
MQSQTSPRPHSNSKTYHRKLSTRLPNQPSLTGSTDAATFASWGVDYVKLDGCYALPADMDHGYPDFGRQLNLTGRQMIYSCSWPVYQIYAGLQVGRRCTMMHYGIP